MADWYFSPVRLNSPGIIEITTSGAMQAELMKHATRKTEEANGAAHLHRTKKTATYKGGVDVLDRTAVGYVKTGDRLAQIDQAYHQTLDSINH